MRDLVLLILLPYLLYASLRKPFIGLSLWLFTSLIPIQTWVYGLATSIRWNMLFALCTMIAYVISKHKPQRQQDKLYTLLFFFLVIATLSTLFHNSIDAIVQARYVTLVKSLVFLLFASLIINSKLHIEAVLWACVLSVAATSAKQGIKVVMSGGGHVVYGISSTFNDNNLSAFATLVTIPMCIYLIAQYKHSKILQLGLVGLVCSSVIFVLGSDSRGGLLGLLALGGFYFFKSKHKLLMTSVAFVLGVFALSLMDDQWFERMNTIKEADQDESFQGRLIAWKLSILLAIQSPIWGAGFDSVAVRSVWTGVLQYWDLVSFIPSNFPEKGHVAHSIYFQVLGDIGFVGFFLFFGIIATCYFRFKRYSRQSDNDELKWLYEVSTYLRLSLVCYFVAGAALSVAYNEMTMLMVALAIVFNRIIQKHSPKALPGRM